MGLLDHAYAAGTERRPLRTYGGRLIPLDAVLAGDAAADAARGRYARNAVIQGSAAELFKAWAATVRHTVAPLGARVVLCLHDELLLHVPEAHASATAAALGRALDDSARRWAGSAAVRFVAEVSVIRSWAEAKG
jgi:DNA polymerase-1